MTVPSAATVKEIGLPWSVVPVNVPEVGVTPDPATSTLVAAWHWVSPSDTKSVGKYSPGMT